MLSGVSGYSYSQAYQSYSYPSIRGAQSTGRAGRVVGLPAAQPEAPVSPVTPVQPAPQVSAPLDKAELLRRWETDPVAMAVRSRIQYPGEGESAGAAKETFANGGVPSANTNAGTVPAGVEAPANAAYADARAGVAPKVAPGGPAADAWPQQPQSAGSPAVGAEEAPKTQSAREVMEEAECQTCKERKYQDGSDDPGVSFKTATHIDPDQAAAQVRGHEMEHVTREQASAAREGRRVVSQSVSYRTAICPECGRAYVSGGTTRTVTMADSAPAGREAEDEGRAPGSFSISA